MYEATWSNKEFVYVGEAKIALPDPPPERDMFNFFASPSDRKYKPTVLPADYLGWDEHEIEALAQRQWHRRLNGEWWIIKNQPLYIPGPALLFFDFWTTETEKKPEFRIEALELFWFWYLYVERDPNIMGMFDVKVRRLGDTEKLLFINLETATRHRGNKHGMQSYTDEEAAKNFARLVNGYKGLPERIFKPDYTGVATERLWFGPQRDMITTKRLKEGFDASDSKRWLLSEIDYQATTDGKYDGRLLNFYHLDEAWKIHPSKMDVMKQLRNIKKVITLNNEQQIIGKMAITSTVELRGKDDEYNTVEIAKELWETSDPNERDSNGRTSSGLVRLMRNYELNAPVDDFGFHKIEQARLFRKNRLTDLEARKDARGILDLKRKEPEDIYDAFSMDEDQCPLNPALCKMQLRCIEEGLDRFGYPIEDYSPKLVEGNLMWENNRAFTKVIFVPMPGGRWHFTQMPKIGNNVSQRPVTYNKNGVKVTEVLPVPNSMAFYRMGMDPYDSDEIIGKGSDGAFAVKRRLYLPDEVNTIRFDEHNMIENPEDMITNTYVCDYKYRHPSPENFYMDAIMTAWFFGCKIFPELDKPGFVIWAKKQGLAGFIQYEPPEITPARKSRMGTKATTNIISTYVEQLVIYTGTFIWNNHLPRLIQQWSKFIPRMRTKFDLAVASGFTELADMEDRYTTQEIRRGWKNYIA
jgi:hypothetical protein